MGGEVHSLLPFFERTVRSPMLRVNSASTRSSKMVEQGVLKEITESVLKEITENLVDRLKRQPNSLAASPDEVRIAWLLGEIERLEGIISNLKGGW